MERNKYNANIGRCTMSEEMKVLKKMHFDIQVTSDDSDVVPAEKHRFIFIYGVATEGLSDFEIAIDGLNEGDTLEVPISEVDIRTYLDRLFLMFSKQTGLVEFNRSMRLVFDLKEISRPEAREIVSAMADAQKMGGCSGSCDCGCH